jgi:hypothetical protein
MRIRPPDCVIRKMGGWGMPPPVAGVAALSALVILMLLVAEATPHR